MKISQLAILGLLATVAQAEDFTSYVAVIDAIPGVETEVAGMMVVVTASSSDSLFYGGVITGLASNLNAPLDCLAVNGCGVHIHSGTSCADSAAQGGHYFETTLDPWTSESHSSNADGQATISSFLDIGTKDVEGKAMLIHAQDGSRIGCGILRRTAESPSEALDLHANIKPLEDAPIANCNVLVIPLEADRLCYIGYADGLEANVSSEDCTAATNGCGTHIHGGSACTDSGTQGGHWFEGDDDPWATLGYTSTTEGGVALFGACASTGIPLSFKDAENLPFVVHAVDGSRIGCGLLTDLTCNTLFSTGHRMTKVGFLGRCRDRCIPHWLSGLSNHFGWELGNC